MTIVLVVAFLVVWLLLSALTAAVCSVVFRGGEVEDRARGYVSEPR